MPQKTPPNDRVKAFHQGFVLRILGARADQGLPPGILRWTDSTSHLFDVALRPRPRFILRSPGHLPGGPAPNQSGDGLASTMRQPELLDM